MEYYYAAWDHYFVTAFPDEIAALDGGAFNGVWKRTGLTFEVWTASINATVPTCRFFSTSFAPKGSHFYTPYAAECASLKANSNWQYEAVAFHLQLPDVNGNCSPGTVPLYRLYNNGQGAAPNHRFTVSRATRDQMLAAGWVGEGSGPDTVFACTPMPAMPKLRGSAILPDPQWATPSTTLFKWTHLTYLTDARMNVARIFVQPFDFNWPNPAPILPGAPLTDRLTTSLMNWAGLIDWLLSKNIYVIVTFNFHSGNRDWPDDGRSLWSDATAQDELIQAWRTFANMYSGRRGIIFDLVNEPHGITPVEVAGNHAIPKAIWNDLYTRIVTAIESVDAARWIIVEPIWGDPKNFQDLRYVGDPKLIYSFHFWAPHYFTHQGVPGYPVAGTVHYPSVTQDSQFQSPKLWDKATLTLEMQGAVDFARSNQARVMMGELGCARAAPDVDRAQWVSDAYSLAEQFGFDSVYWQYDGWNIPATFKEGWGFENSTVEPIVLDEFRRN